MPTIARLIRALTSEDNVYTFRLWDWIIPGLFMPLRGQSWARHLPNILTSTRLVLGLPVIIWLAIIELSPSSQLPAAWALIVSLILLRITDILDGRAARDLGVVSDLGSKLDPLADGIIGFGMAIVAALTLPAHVGPAIEIMLIAVIATRFVLDGAVMIIRFRESRRGVLPVANKWGKLKYNLDFLLLLIFHAGILFSIPAVLTIMLALGLGLTPLTLLLGWKNLQAHRAHMDIRPLR